MTTSRYINTNNFTAVTENSFNSLIEGIKNSCTFKLNNSIVKSDNVKKICKITARSYVKDNTTYYHISNDDRRLLIKYLKENYDITLKD